MYPMLASAVADEHVRDLLNQAEQARMVQAARRAAIPRPNRRRLLVGRTRFQRLHAFGAWLGAGRRQPVPTPQ